MRRVGRPRSERISIVHTACRLVAQLEIEGDEESPAFVLKRAMGYLGAVPKFPDEIGRFGNQGPDPPTVFRSELWLSWEQRDRDAKKAFTGVFPGHWRD